nr:hypothetical protein [Tanacetum cinerariifolium]
QLEEERAAKAQNWKLPVCYDDDEDEERSDSLDDNISSGLPPFSAITPNEPVLSLEEPDKSLSMGDEHLDTIPATESDELIKSGVENLIPIPSESKGIPEHVCDIPFHDNSLPLDVSKDQFEDFSEPNDEFSSTDVYSFSFDKIDYVEASPPDSELVSSEVMKIVIPKVGGIEASNDNPIPFYDPIISGTPPNLTPSGESDFFLEVDAFLAVEDEPTSSQFPKSYLDPEGDMLLLEEFLNDDHSSDFKTKYPSTSRNSLLEETNNFDNSLPEFTTFSKVLFDAEYESDSSDNQSCSDEDVLEKIILKPLCEEEIIPMKSLHTHDSSLPISSKIDSLLDEFAGELTLLKSIPPGTDETEFVSVNSDAKIKSFSPSPILIKDSNSLVEEINLFCTPDYPMPLGIKDKDYDSERDILIRKDFPRNNTLSFAEKESLHFDIPLFSRPPEKSPDLLSHRCGTVKKFNTHRSHLNECPMMIHGQNNPILDLPVCYDDDEDEERSDSLDDNISSGLPPFSAITPNEPVLSLEEPDNSLRGIEASNDNPIPFYDPIISGTPPKLTSSIESDFFLEVDAFLAVEDEPTSSQFPKSYLDPEGDMLVLEAFLNDDHSSDFKTNDDQSCSDEDVLEKIISKPLCEEEIIPMKSLHTHDSSLPISSKIDSLLDEFTGELTLLKSIPPGTDETGCDFEEDVRLIEKLLYDNSSSRPPKEFVSVNSDAKIKSFSPSPILVKDSDSLVEEINLFCTPDYPMSLGIEDKDYDSERDILI